MDQIIMDFKDVVINKKGSPSSRMFVEISSDTKADEDPLTSRGLFNGDILGCTLCKQAEGKVILECHRFKFFDIILNRIKKDFFPQMVNVNAIIELKDAAGEEYIMFIKREKEVYAYPDYWDFPAGLVPYDISPIERLVDRIEKDIPLKKESLFIPEEPSFIVSRGKFFGMYYQIKSNISKQELEQRISAQNWPREIIFVKKSELPNFLEQNDNVYPSFLNDVF